MEEIPPSPNFAMAESEAFADSGGYCPVRSLIAILLVLAGCSSTGGPDAVVPEPIAAVSEPTAAASEQIAAVSEPITESAARDAIRIPLSLYVVSDADDAASPLSSVRTTEGLSAIAERIGEIWMEADIVFAPVSVHAIAVPPDVLRSIANSGNTDLFFNQVGTTFDVPDPGAVNGFYVRSAARVNGFTPRGSRVFFVVDEPSVHDERVSSHELGHIFGLRHDLNDTGRLMFSGTNGMKLTEREQVVARYGAEGLLDATR